ncbi:probable F420-dependent oxidoreductase, Rv2161c family [Geodermatophilus dictyosporus]|uniref:Probable F420-dependent oxidoreductase, Rv2161c family n=1 Tax=Geodermatophilus dictyosporus TaxID=1523247 RepID=A0A1I5JKI1_9ACTN|nr:LLM class flavin-dependent oxidoreductase [Geodermatophilus dictyosporus]SFO73307.1 probable F420-dependent oxidoreductase, Rv2161c family [Geodermatophilus dictyosporus]
MRVVLTLSSEQQAVATEARAAEEAGYDGIATGEHLFFHSPHPNAFVALAAAAGATSRIRLLSSLTVLPLYPAALAAKLATTLDQVSGGRFDMGVGVGGEYPPEFVAAGVDVAERGPRTDEALDLLRRLWAGGPVEHAGRHARVEGLALSPGPVQPGGPPLWLGGRKAPAIRRAGRFADVWMPYMYTPEQLARSLAEVREAAERAGRDPSAVRGAVFCWGGVDTDADRSRREVVEWVSAVYQQDFAPLADRYLLHGDPDRVAARAREFAEAGADTLVFSPVGAGDRRREGVGLFTEAVLPRLAAAG